MEDEVVDDKSPNPVLSAVAKLAAMNHAGVAEREVREQAPQNLEQPSVAPQPGQALLADPDAALEAFRATGGMGQDLVQWYASGGSPIHLLRVGAQPQMVKASMKTMVQPLAAQLCREAGVQSVGATLLAEQVVEARVDEAYARMLSGLALEEGDISKADKLGKMADRCSARMGKSLDQLHRMRRPRVNVRIGQAANVNLGEQTLVNESADSSTSSDLGTRNETGNAG